MDESFHPGIRPAKHGATCGLPSSLAHQNGEHNPNQPYSSDTIVRRRLGKAVIMSPIVWSLTKQSRAVSKLHFSLQKTRKRVEICV